MDEEIIIQRISGVLGDRRKPMKARYRALFTLKNLGGEKAVRAIGSYFDDDSALLKHEMAYCLGQMQHASAISILKDLVCDIHQDVIVRHEAAEAIAALGDNKMLPILKQYSGPDTTVELAETCRIAIDMLNWMQTKSEVEKIEENEFHSVDPAPPLASESSLTTAQVKEHLLNESLSLFERYRALFTLRNRKSEESIQAITEGLKCSSALFRHEIAFVLGQLANQAGESALTEALSDPSEHGMVRHECAEALGAIATETCNLTLMKFVKDPERLVRESCEVALDMSDYANTAEFQYANGLVTIQGS